MATSVAPGLAPGVVSGAIDAAQVARYHADGFMVIRGVFSAHQVAELDRGCVCYNAPISSTPTTFAAAGRITQIRANASSTASTR